MIGNVGRGRLERRVRFVGGSGRLAVRRSQGEESLMMLGRKDKLHCLKKAMERDETLLENWW